MGNEGSLHSAAPPSQRPSPPPCRPQPQSTPESCRPRSSPRACAHVNGFSGMWSSTSEAVRPDAIRGRSPRSQQSVADAEFPDRFLSEAATAAHQVEDWWAWAHRPGTPVAEPSGTAIEHYARSDPSHALPRRPRIDASVQRRAGAGGTVEGRFDEGTIRHYRDVTEGVRGAGMTPMVTINHFTLPACEGKAGEVQTACPAEEGRSDDQLEGQRARLTQYDELDQVTYRGSHPRVLDRRRRLASPSGTRVQVAGQRDVVGLTDPVGRPRGIPAIRRPPHRCWRCRGSTG